MRKLPFIECIGTFMRGIVHAKIVVAFLLSSVAMAEEHPLPHGGPVRYLTWNVPASVLAKTIAADTERRLDGEVRSDNVLDYDVIVVFLNGWSDIDRFEYTKEFGISPDEVKRTSESDLVYTATIDFRGRSSSFNVILVNELNFMKRDSNCYGRLMLDLMTYFASESDWSRFPMEQYVTCSLP